MNLNRFFFRCPRCLFKFSADVEGFRCPDVRACPVCAREYVECLGATKGVLSLGVPCNDVCGFAEAPTCSCSCGGKNHGSRLLIPVLRGVVDFDTGKFATLEAARREWAAWQAKLSEVKGKLGPESQARRELVESLPGVYQSKAWANRNKLLAGICQRIGIVVSSGAALVATVRAPAPTGDLFSWGEKWAHVSPQFRGHQFTVSAVEGISVAFSCSPA